MERQVELVVQPRWSELLREVNARIAAGIPGDVMVPKFWEAWRAFEIDFEEIDVPLVETEADLPRFEAVYSANLETALCEALGYVRTELPRWGAAT